MYRPSQIQTNQYWPFDCMMGIYVPSEFWSEYAPDTEPLAPEEYEQKIAPESPVDTRANEPLDTSWINVLVFSAFLLFSGVLLQP